MSIMLRNNGIPAYNGRGKDKKKVLFERDFYVSDLDSVSWTAKRAMQILLSCVASNNFSFPFVCYNSIYYEITNIRIHAHEY